MLVGTRRWSRQAAKDSQSSREGTYRDGKFDVVYCMVSDLYHTCHVNHISSYMIWFNCPNLSRHSRTSGRATGQMQVICGRRNFVHASAVPKLQRCDFERFAEVCRFKSIHRYSSLFMSLFMSSFHFWRMACFSWATETSWNGLSLKLCWSALHFLGHGWVLIQARYSAIQPIQPHFKVWTLHHLQSPEWWLAQGCCRFNIAQSLSCWSFLCCEMNCKNPDLEQHELHCPYHNTMIKTCRCGCLHPCLAVEPHQAKAEFANSKIRSIRFVTQWHSLSPL